ncbi:MAG: amino acid carrier protein [bacterium]|nr:amino acid carrier protein [bacterium]
MSFLLILILLIFGIYFSFKINFVHFNPVKTMKSILKKENKEGVSSFKALCLSLANRVGVGSLSGVSLSLYLGGIGSVFWMWISTIICSSTTMLETVVSLKYRKKINDYEYEGGPFYYISLGLKKYKMAILYAVLFLISYAGGFLTIQSNTISRVVTEIVPIKEFLVGIIIVLLTSFVIFKNKKELIDIVSKIIPFITLVYIISCLVIIIPNYCFIDDIIKLIIKEAFNPKSFVTGFTIGITKSIFSTEAGIGTGTIASSSATNSTPFEQGLVQVFGVFFDTFIISTLTVFVVMLSPSLNLNLVNVNGIEITNYAFIYNLGSIGGLIITISIILFAYSTIIGGYYYGEVAFKYIFKNKYTLYFKVVVLLLLFVSTIISSDIIWNIIDKFIIVLGLINVYTVYKLEKDALSMIKYK